MSRRLPPPAPRRSLALIALLAGASCVGPSERPEEAEAAHAGSLDELRALVAEGSVRPVQGELREPGAPGDPASGAEPAADPVLETAERLARADQEGREQAREAGAAPEAAGAPPQDPAGGGATGEAAPPREGGPPEPAAAAPPETPPRSSLPNPYLVFGERIVVGADGRITKPYPMPPGRGRQILDLMALYGNFPLDVVAPGAERPAPSPDRVEAVLLEGWDVELYQDMRVFPPKTPQTVAISDWLVCTAGHELLEEVEYFVNLFAASVPQIEIEAKIVELVETEEFDWGVRSPDGVPIFDFPAGTLVDSLDYSFPNSVGTDGNEALLSLGAVQDGVAFNAILEAVQRWDNVSIISRPKIAVREGGRAEIVNIEDLPFFVVNSINATGGLNTQLQFKEVGVKLYIIPRVVGTSTLALHIDIEASQESGSVTTFQSSSDEGIETPVISSRGVRTIVYLQPGEALILGGQTTRRDVEVERKVPILGDIPILGYLFKSVAKRAQYAHVLFFIRPRVLEGADFNRAWEPEPPRGV